MADRLPDLVLPCWADDDENLLVEETESGMVRLTPSTSFVLLSSYSQDRLRGFLNDIARRRGVSV